MYVHLIYFKFEYVYYHSLNLSLLINIKLSLVKKFYTVKNLKAISLKKYLLPALLVAFMAFGLAAFFSSKPSEKSGRIYKLIQNYSPYYLDKRFGGLRILSKEDPEFQEKPDNMTLFKEFERLEKKWGKKHLKLNGSTLIVYDFNGTQTVEIALENKDELKFVQNFYGVKK